MNKIFSHKIFKDGAWYSLANLVTQLSSLVGVLFVARYLGPTNLGIYSFLQNYIAAFVTVFSGIDMYANWRIVKSRDYYTELRHYIRQKAIITIPVVVMLCAVSYLYLPSDIARFVPLLCIPIISGILTSCVFVLQYHKKARLVATSMMISSLIILLAKIIAVLTAQPFSVFVAINSIDGLLIILVAAFYILSHRENQTATEKKPLELFKLLKNSTFSIIYIVFWYIVVRADQFFVPAYFDAYSLGIYSSAVKVIEMTNVIIIVMQAVILPRMGYILAGESQKRMYITMLMYTLAGFITAIAIQFLAPIAVAILFGPEFIETVSLLRVYAWSIPGLFVSYLFVTVAMENRTIKVLAYHSVLTALLMLGSLYITAQSDNILSIAKVSVAVYTLSAFSLMVLWKRKLI